MNIARVQLLGRILGWSAVFVSILAWHILHVPGTEAGTVIAFLYVSVVVSSGALPVLLLVMRTKPEIRPSMTPAGARFLVAMSIFEKLVLIMVSVLGILVNLGWLQCFILGGQVRNVVFGA